MSDPISAPAGWYQDPCESTGWRYWDGTEWTPHTNRGSTPSPPPPAPPAPADLDSARCLCETPDDYLDGEVDRTITLVHGTFARHAKWVRPTGALARALGALPKTRVRAFCWSGRNREGDRIRAGQALHDELVELAARHPDALHHVIGHSHGGNVALYAMRRPDGEIDPALHSVHVTTLSTPFITIERRRLPWLAGAFVFLTMLGWIQLLLILPISFVLSFVEGSGVDAGPWIVLAVLTVVLAIVGPALLSPLALPASGRRRYFARLFGRSVETDIELIRLPRLAPERLAVYRAPGDEATGVLGLTQLLTWAARRALIVAPIPLILAVIGLAVADAVGLFGSTGAMNTPFGVVTWLGFAVLVTTAVLLFGVHVGIGWDTTFLAPHAQISAEASPPGESTVNLLATPPGLLAHGVYGSEELIAKLTAQIQTWEPDAEPPG